MNLELFNYSNTEVRTILDEKGTHILEIVYDYSIGVISNDTNV